MGLIDGIGNPLETQGSFVSLRAGEIGGVSLGRAGVLRNRESRGKFRE